MDPPQQLLSQFTADAIKNCIIFAGDKTTYDGKSMYNYLPNSAHDIFGFDSNYGFLKEFKNGINNKHLMNNYDLQLSPIPHTADTVALNKFYGFPDDTHYTGTGDSITKTINNVVTIFTTANVANAYVNISNTMACNKVNDYVLLHLPSLPTMANKIASNNIVQNAYTKLHL